MREKKQIKKENNVQTHTTAEVGACTHIHERRK